MIYNIYYVYVKKKKVISMYVFMREGNSHINVCVYVCVKKFNVRMYLIYLNNIL